MLVLLLAAGLVSGLSPRPTSLVPPGHDSEYAEHLHGAALALAASVHRGACPDGAVVRSLGYTELGAIGGIGPGYAGVDPASIAYKEHVKIEGCGQQDRRDNFFVVMTGASGWAIQPMLPGDSLTTPVQQHDALLSTLQTIKSFGDLGSCNAGVPAYRLTDTLVTDDSQVKEGIWTERWIQQSCGQDRTVRVHFTPRPDGKGTSLIVEQAWSEAKFKS